MQADSSSNSLQTIPDVACTLCGCVCDDLEFSVVDNQVKSIKRACEKAENWYHSLREQQTVACQIEGKESSLAEAISQGSQILGHCKYPLIYGLSSSSTEGQRTAVEVADRLCGVIDTSASTCHAPSILAFQHAGESTSSLGEVKNRADLIVFWGSDPVESHPRHLERYSRSSDAEFLDNGKIDRFVVVVDTIESETAKLADLFIKIDPGQDFEVLWALRAMIASQEIEKASIGGVPIKQLEELSERMRQCGFGAFFFGLGLAKGPLAHLHVEALLKLATDLHRHTRVVVRRMRRYGDVAGADSVLCWQTGYPFSVDLSRGYPRYQPGEFSAGEMLERNDPDCCLLVGTDGLAKLPQSAIDWLNQIPTVVLMHGQQELPFEPTVTIPVATYGVHLPGTAYRMDEIPIPLRPILHTDLPSDVDVLEKLLEPFQAPRSTS